MQEKGFKEGIKDALPTAMGYISVGIAFGLVASAAKLSPIEVGLMSALVYGGSAQFAMVSLLLMRADLFSISLTVFLVNLRNMLMSLHAATIFTKTSFLNNIVIASLITDESYGVLLGENVHNHHISANWMHGNNIMGYTAWILSSMLGATLGNAIPNPKILGLDFAVVAMFIGLFIFQLDVMMSEGLKKVILLLSVVALSFWLCSIFLSSALSVLIATLLGCSVGVLLDEDR